MATQDTVWPSIYIKGGVNDYNYIPRQLMVLVYLATIFTEGSCPNFITFDGNKITKS
jgi:hypothetical protein